ncbi:hypothetical protein KY319_00035 [Candidatus Woesearchaeota archaeon]|nr:hypothetical protein [Candidatus Woesearchaeota archaeon]
MDDKKAFFREVYHYVDILSERALTAASKKAPHSAFSHIVFPLLSASRYFGKLVEILENPESENHSVNIFKWWRSRRALKESNAVLSLSSEDLRRVLESAKRALSYDLETTISLYSYANQNGAVMSEIRDVIDGYSRLSEMYNPKP